MLLTLLDSHWCLMGDGPHLKEMDNPNLHLLHHDFIGYPKFGWHKGLHLFDDTGVAICYLSHSGIRRLKMSWVDQRYPKSQRAGLNEPNQTTRPNQTKPQFGLLFIALDQTKSIVVYICKTRPDWMVWSSLDHWPVWAGTFEGGCVLLLLAFQKSEHELMWSLQVGVVLISSDNVQIGAVINGWGKLKHLILSVP